ncbi:MAG: sigma-70 family RNA polymerase sigma factor [Candidatus Acidiferrales bacterium]
MPPEGTPDRLRQLIKVGQSRGHVLYDEIDAVLAPGREGVAELDQVLSELASNAIEVVDEPRTENSIPDESFLDRAESLGDLAPIRSYLQEVLTVARLTVKEEKQLARRIKEGSFKAGARLYATDESGKIYDGSDATELSSTPQNAEEAEKRLIEANLWIAVGTATHFVDRGFTLLDLVQEGNIGLMRAVREYNYVREYRFSTYATWWVRKAIQVALQRIKKPE